MGQFLSVDFWNFLVEDRICHGELPVGFRESNRAPPTPARNLQQPRIIIAAQTETASLSMHKPKAFSALF